MTQKMMIRPAEDKDWKLIWALLEPVFRAGETYAVATDISEDEARDMWLTKPRGTFVAEDSNGTVLGTYYMKANQAGPGSHVCNCGYIVGEAARGRGIARAMCVHSQDTAREMGFKAMQYNLVVSTNDGAVRLWQALGFDVVGTIPKAFRHPTHGTVDAYVMHKSLVDE